MASLMLYIKVSVQEQQKSTKSSEVCRERKNVEKSRRQTIKTGTSKDTDAPSIMNGNAEVIIVRLRNLYFQNLELCENRDFFMEPEKKPRVNGHQISLLFSNQKS